MKNTGKLFCLIQNIEKLGELWEVSGMRGEIRLSNLGLTSAVANHKRLYQAVNGKLLYLQGMLEKLSELGESGGQFFKNRYRGLLDDSRRVFLQLR